ncbi:hypothetical protein DFQ01_108206 [Paenibacillus cellulosilyticus]|uniref:DUF3829 domain-containing protein n=1 Tax=Paenibacillus cellulosilyticus TaxID=375489 RepID=A0A2V2YUI1_9BACL|nr:hypothetical protein [Paenibacillus cellulosilyticus]PWW02927.1 hypothetical protein DFQ01_108206 [Paenibacillus cellulosilyticus]QKS45835.1 hypothetical protein HUB94_16345 [Paenibacillus cellulosilyticus]
MKIKSKASAAAMMCLLSAVLLAACDNNDKKTESSPNESTSAVDKDQQAEPTPSEQSSKDDPVLSDYNALKSTNPDISDRLKFLNENLTKLQPESADQIVRDLVAKYDEELPSRQEPFYKENVATALNALDWPITKDNASQIKDDSIRTMVEAVFADGYKLEAVEGSIFPIVDYNSLRQYKTALTSAYATYIELLAQLSDQKSMSDGGLVITWDQFADRMMMYDQYLSQFASSPDASKVKTMYEGALTIYMSGADNSPIYDRDGSYKLLDEVKTSYERIAKDFADTQTGKIIQGYLDVLQQSNWQVRSTDGKSAVQAVDSYREKALAEIK